MKRNLAQGASQRLSSIDVPLLAAAAAMPAVILVAHLPTSLLLSAIAALAFGIAALAATAGFLTRTPRNTASLTIWDFAGACVLIGIAAGVFGESDQVSQLFGIATTPP